MELKTTLLLWSSLALPALAGAQQDPPGTTPPPPKVQNKPNTPPDPEGGKPAFEGRSGSIEALGRVLVTRIRKRRQAAEKAIGKDLEDLRWDYDTNRELLDKRFAAIARHGHLITGLLLEKLTPEKASRESRNLARNAARILRRIAEPSIVNDLVALLASPSTTARASAAFVLGIFRGPAIEKALLPLLEDRSTTVRIEAIRSLGEMRAAAAASRLMQMLASARGGDQNLLRDLVASVGSIASRAGYQQAIEVFRTTESQHLRAGLVRYFLAAHVPEATPALLAALEDKPGFELRTQMIEALGHLAPPPARRKVIAVLKDYLSESTYTIRSAAAAALYRLKDRSGLSVLLEQPQNAIDKSPREPFGYLARARVYLRLEEWHKASLDYKRAIDRANRGQLEKQVFYELSRCYAEQKQWERSLRVLKDAHIAPKEFAASPYSLLTCYDKLRKEARNAKWFNSKG